MRSALRSGRRIALILGLVLLAAGGAAETVSLGRDQAVALARQAWLSGDVALAFAVVSKIVAVDPEDVEALLLLSATTEALGRPEEAVTYGKRAWFAATKAERPVALRYEIALQTAHAALSAGHKRRTALWLGRAVEAAPSDATRSQSAEDLRQVRAQTALSFSANLQVSPTDNLNNGATSGLWTVEDYVIGTISGWSVAHAGFLATGQVKASYNLGVGRSGRSRSALGLGISTTLHVLSPSEAAANPDLDASDLDTWRATASWTQERLLNSPAMQGRPPMRLTVEAAQSWFDGVPYAPSLRAEVAFPLTQTGDLTLEAGLERQWPQSAGGTITGTSLRLSGQRDLTLPWGEGALAYGLGATFLRSDEPNSTYDTYDASLILDPGIAMGKVTTHVGLGMSWRHNDDYSLGFGGIHATNGRTDRGLWLRAGLGLEEVTLAGMTPTLTLQRQMTWSNISKYQTDSTSLYLGLSADF